MEITIDDHGSVTVLPAGRGDRPAVACVRILVRGFSSFADANVGVLLTREQAEELGGELLRIASETA